jgi:hypothetical protein
LLVDLVFLYLAVGIMIANEIPRLFPSTRFTVVLLLCLGFAVQYTQRINLSIAIVCMVKRRITTNIESTSLLNQTYNRTIKLPQKYGVRFINDKQFPWTELQQQIILGAYWSGYVVTLIPGRQADLC